MICRYCGMENEGDIEFCAFCGAKLRMGDEPSDENEIVQSKVGEKNQGRTPSILEMSKGGDEKVFLAIIGAFLIAIVVIAIASFSLIKKLILSASDWTKENPTSIAMTQTQSAESYQPSTEVGQPTAITPTPTIETYHPIGVTEELFFGIRSFTVYRPFQSIGILRLDSLEEEMIVDDPNGFTPLMMCPDSGQSFISPDQRSIALSSGYNQSELLIFSVGNPEPFYEIEGYPQLGQFYNFSLDGKYISFPSRDLQSSELITNILDLNLGNLYPQTGLIYGIFVPGSDQAIGFRLGPSEQNVIAVEKIDFLHNQTTTLLNIDLSLDEITYIPPFLSQNGELLFYVDGSTLMSYSLQNGEIRTIYQFDFAYDAWVFSLYQSDMIVIVDGLDPQVANLYLYNPQNDHLVMIDRRVSTTVFHYDQRYFANVPPIAISPDGRRIAYMVGQIGEMELRIAELSGNNIVTLSENTHLLSFLFSPDNQRIAYIQYEDSSDYGDLYITDTSGEERKFLEKDVISFEFIANGEYIVYSKYEYPEEDISKSSVYRIGIDGGEKVHLFNEEGTFVFIHTP